MPKIFWGFFGDFFFQATEVIKIFEKISIDLERDSRKFTFLKQDI